MALCVKKAVGGVCCLLLTFSLHISGQEPPCARFTVQHGSVQNYELSRGRQAARITCERGYTRGEDTSEHSYCIGPGTWRPSPSDCYRAPCPTPPGLEDGFIVGALSSYDDGDEIEYRCLQSHRPVQQNGRKHFRLEFLCVEVDLERVWVMPHNLMRPLTPQKIAEKLPRCQLRLACEDPGDILYGHRRPAFHAGPAAAQRHLYVGHTITYSCPTPGDQLIGNATVKCLLGAVLSSPPPSCLPRHSCPPFPPPEHGRFVLGDAADSFIRTGDHVTLTCKVGWCINVTDEEAEVYVTKKNYRRQCGDSGQWMYSDPVCEECSCPVPTLAHGYVVNESRADVYELGDNVRMECDEGYQLVGGGHYVTCMSYRGWSGFRDLRCVEVNCPRFEVENAWVTPQQYLYKPGDNVSVLCDDGYELYGPVAGRLTCSDWTWLPDVVSVCRLKYGRPEYCHDPGVPVGAERIRYSEGRMAQYECKDLFVMDGNDTISCDRATRQWNRGPPKCTAIYHTESNEEVGKKLWKKFRSLDALDLEGERRERSFSDVATPGDPLILYFVIDQSGSIPPEDFNQMMLLCKALIEMMRVFPLDRASHSKHPVRIGLVGFVGSAATKLFPWQRRGGNRSSILSIMEEQFEHLKNSTNLHAGLSKVIDSIEFGKTYNHIEWQRHRQAPNIKKGVLLLTDGVYNVDGDPTSQADRLKELGYSIYAISIKDEEGDKVLRKLVSDPEEDIIYLRSRASYKDVARLMLNQSQEFLECGWSSFKSCDQFVDKQQIAGGTEADVIDYPWMVQLHHNANWNPRIIVEKGQKVPVGHGVGGATFISPEWVLTAAHNIRPRAGRDKHAEKLLLTFGGDGARKSLVSKTIVHSRFRYKDRGMENDIALLKLDTPVQFSPKAHSICLPERVPGLKGQNFETSVSREEMYEVGATGHISGWGKDEDGRAGTFKAACVPLINCPELVVDDPKICCAGRTEEPIRDAGKQDSGGPLTRNFPAKHDSREKRFVQIGIISFNAHEEVIDEPKGKGAYTKVTEHISWIKDRIREE